MSALFALPAHLDENTYANPDGVIERLIEHARLSTHQRRDISQSAADLIGRIRSDGEPGLMEVFLAEYGLSTQEGVALMCLAEALLRVPDAATMDALIEDKIAPSDWSGHLGQSTSPLVNASTWALLLTGRVLDDEGTGLAGVLRGAVKRLGEPMIRAAVGRAMREMGQQFVLGETIESAMGRAREMEVKGFTYSYDMLGEAALTDEDARAYHLSYSKAISSIAEHCAQDDVRDNPGISVKLSALHPRYEIAQSDRVMRELVPRLRSLAQIAASAGMGLNVDAEEADRLTLSMAVSKEVLKEPALAGWRGFGVVVQAYGPRTHDVLAHLYGIAKDLDRQIMVRLVKGAYWDTEVKRAQVAGVAGFPVFTRKPATDISYIANARTLLDMTDRIYPQFATHNAHTVQSILQMADDTSAFEFQRLHGMGEALHRLVMQDHKTKCRIYAPVGAHKDLLAYLVRRLLENGANSSFVNQIVDPEIEPQTIASDPFEAFAGTNLPLTKGPDLFQPERANARGYDLAHLPTLTRLLNSREHFEKRMWDTAPSGTSETAILNPANPNDTVGHVLWASADRATDAITNAKEWNAPRAERMRILTAAADLYEENDAEIFALLTREAGKTLPDAVAELREAVDFLRYYAANAPDAAPIGTFVCISPWNFPLAIFTGQIAAALATANAVLAKPAEQTPLIAQFAVSLLHRAGVPKQTLQLLLGAGDVGAALTFDPRVDGVAFTGGIDTARLIRRSMTENLHPGAPLIAETGGLNAMIVDSTALPEQAVTAVVESAFQSAGQRCSALRCLYVQRDIADDFIRLLTGAMRELNVANPWQIETDVGPVIDADARASIQAHIDAAHSDGRLIFQSDAPRKGTFVAPALVSVSGIQDLECEIFGPVLHIATYDAQDLDRVIQDINRTGYGLTFGLQTRIDDRVQYIADKINAGNVYVNRNQIGAMVGSQPFGGAGLSGTGPKAGGPLYLNRFCQNHVAPAVPLSQTLPGPTGELNRLSLHQKAPIACLGPDVAVQQQIDAITALGGVGIAASPDQFADLLANTPIGGAIWWGDEKIARTLNRQLAQQEGAILPLITSRPDQAHVMHERHLCVDTTAAGGNAALLGEMS